MTANYMFNLQSKCYLSSTLSVHKLFFGSFCENSCILIFLVNLDDI